MFNKVVTSRTFNLVMTLIVFAVTIYVARQDGYNAGFVDGHLEGKFSVVRQVSNSAWNVEHGDFCDVYQGDINYTWTTVWKEEERLKARVKELWQSVSEQQQSKLQVNNF